MSVRLEYYTDIKEGRMQDGVRNLMGKEIHHFNGSRVRITIEKFKARRSQQQNNLWHAYLGLLAPELGYELQELKDRLNWRYLKEEKIDTDSGEIYYAIKSTADLSVADFAALLDRLIRDFAEDGMILPEADPNYKDNAASQERWKINYA